MKKLAIIAIALLFVFAGFSNSYAKTRYRTYEVAEIQSGGIVLMDYEGGKFLVEKDASKIKGGLKVGDSVRYDATKKRLKKNAWQPATITKMNDRTVTLQFKNGDSADVKMRSKYRKDLKKGDQVSYSVSKDQIKKNNEITPEEK